MLFFYGTKHRFFGQLHRAAPTIFVLFGYLFLSGCATPPAQLSLGQIESAYNNAVSSGEAKLAKNPGDTGLRLKLGEFHYQFNNYDKVKVLLSGIDDKRAKIILAKALTHLKEYTAALEIFEQFGELKDDEYLYLYAAALEGQNLFPKATLIYNKTGGIFKEKARERIKQIGLTVEEGIPPDIKNTLRKYADFISAIDKEEAVILRSDETMEIFDNNTSVSEIHLAQQVLKEKGKDLAEVEIGYDSTDERVELEFARTITADGKIVYAGRENTRDVSKYMNFPLYSNARAFIISMPSVDIGAVIEYKVKVYSSKLITGDKFSFIYRLREQYPVVSADFQLITPAARKINFKFLNREYAGNFNLNPLIQEKNHKKIYRWSFEKIDPIIPEENMPPVCDVNAAFAVSSFKTWDQLYQWWYPLFKDKINLNKEIKAFVKTLTRDAAGPLEKARKIYEFCSRQVRYVGIEYGQSGYEPHRADDIFLNRYGDCKDKATLLVAMLREAGLTAYPVLIPTRGLYPIAEDFPQVNFNHAIAVLFYEGKYIFMDGTAMTTSFGDLPLGDQDRKVVVIQDDTYKIVTTPLLADNELNFKMRVTIDENEDARVEREVRSRGFFSSSRRYYLKYTHPQVIEDDIRAKMTQISPFSKLLYYKIENVDDFTKEPLLRYTFDAKKLLNPADNLRVLSILGDIDIDVTYAAKDQRQFAVEFDGIFKEIAQVRVNLPVNLKVKFLPHDKNITNNWFVFKSRYRKNEEHLELTREFSIRKRIVEKKDYHEFKKQMEEAFYFLKEEIILEKI